MAKAEVVFKQKENNINFFDILTEGEIFYLSETSAEKDFGEEWMKEIAETPMLKLNNDLTYNAFSFKENAEITINKHTECILYSDVKLEVQK